MSRSSAAAVRLPEAAPNVAASDAPLSIELRRDLDLRAEDAAALDALIESRPETGVFLSRAWLSGFFADPADGLQPSLAILREGSALRGVAPIAVRRARTHVGVGLLGGGAGSDRVDLLAARGFEAACSDALLTWLGEALGSRSFILGLRGVPADSPLWGAIHRAAVERRLTLVLQPREIDPLPYLDLLDASVGIGGAPSQPRNWRSLEKHRRWLERRGRLTIDILRDADEALDALETLARFLHVRWGRSGGGSALDSPRAIRFHRHAVPLLLKERRLRMIRLSADARTIAVFYGLATGGWWGYYLAGYDREWAGRIHLGQLTLAIAIEYACREGATEFDFLKGAERVKYLWPVRDRATLDADVYSGRPGAQARRAARAARDASVACLKSARTLFSR